MEGTKRHPIHAHYKVGFNRDGKLQAMQVRLVLDGGAYKSKTFPVTTRMAIEAAGPYIVPNIDTISTSVYTNNVYSDALRGFGSPQVDFCSESLMDEIAKELNMDPVELRKKNMLYEGCTSTTGQRPAASASAKASTSARAKPPAIRQKLNATARRKVDVTARAQSRPSTVTGPGSSSAEPTAQEAACQTDRASTTAPTRCQVFIFLSAGVLMRPSSRSRHRAWRRPRPPSSGHTVFADSRPRRPSYPRR